MMEQTIFVFTFHLKGGLTLKVTSEDDGLTMDQYRSDIEQCIEDKQYYTVHDIVEDEWTIINAREILAFSIKDIGPNYEESEEEGFSFK